MKQQKITLAVLVAYTTFLLWLVLFKLTDPISVIAHYQHRSLNLIPFAGYSSASAHEAIDNFVVFVPLGLLVGAKFKQASLPAKLASIFLLSVAVEVLQFILAIGRTDITDVITNTVGGLFGLAVYDLASRYLNTKKIDWCISLVLAILLVVFVLLRFFVLRVRY